MRRLALMLLGMVPGLPASAAITCSVAVTAISVHYDPFGAGDTVASGSYTVACTRLASDANSLSWTLGANDGLQASSAQVNRVALNGNHYLYQLFRTAPYTNVNRWRDNNNNVRFSGTLSFGASLSASQTGAFDLLLSGSQPVQPAGTYTDLVTVTLRGGNNAVLAQSAFGVSVVTVASCVLQSPPGSVSFTYTSFQPAPASASTFFGVRCTTGLPYTLSLDGTSGTLLGLSYSLSLPQAAGTGNGATQTYAITGSVPAGQAGTCATAVCSASETRTLTISY